MKKILFLTGTRADYGKIKPLMKAIEANCDFELFVFVCGMHLSEVFGSTYEEVQKDGYRNVYVAYGLSQSQSASVNLGNTIVHLSGYVDNIKPDMIVVHGDRMDALAGAVVGAIHNILVGHIEGGELSGTLDESTRHAISKFAHAHFVCNEEAKSRLVQMGEVSKHIFVVGSPDIDIMMSKELPDLEESKRKYEILFDNYGILMYHPVTTEFDCIGEMSKKVVNAIFASKKNYIVVYPNNDLGSEMILNEYKRFIPNKRFRVFPSLRFEYFLTFLKNADFIIGNSSAGIREAGVYGIPAIDIGTRQTNRYSLEELKNIQHVQEDEGQIISAIARIDKFRSKSKSFGDGNSTEKFMKIICRDSFWSIELQKRFVDIDM